MGLKANGSAGAGGVFYSSVTVDDGAHKGKTGYIKVSDLRDKGDGPATTDLPVPDVHVLTVEQSLNAGVPGPWRHTETLAKGTRVLETGERPGLPAENQVWVRVVDGPNTGAEGYVEAATLQDERP